MQLVAKRLFAALLVGILAGLIAGCYTLLKHPDTNVTDDSEGKGCADCPWYYADPYLPIPFPPIYLPPPPHHGTPPATVVRPIDPKKPVKREDAGTIAKQRAGEKTPSRESTETGNPKEKRRD
jgi:hypothetical protein